MVFLVILTALTCHGSDPVQFYLDLTTPLPESAAGMGVPGTVIFGSTHSGLRRLAPTLPLEVTIQDLYPAAVTPLDQVTVAVLIRNTGSSSIPIPISRDFAAVLKRGNADQSELVVMIDVLLPRSRRWSISMMGSAVGSPSVPGSLLQLPPNGTIMIRLAGKLNSSELWNDSGGEPANLSVQARIREEYYEQDRYFVKKRSEDITSVADKRLFWRR